MDLETVISSVMVIGAYSALVTVAKNLFDKVERVGHPKQRSEAS